MKKAFLLVFLIIVTSFLMGSFLSNNKLSKTRIGLPEAYPNPQYTIGLADTLDYKTLTADYNGLTYSQKFRNVTEATKKQVLTNYPHCPKSSEIDHLDPVANGGSNDVRNLWCQPEHVYWNGKDYGFHAKDRLEAYLISQMKVQKITPKEVYDCLINDWIDCSIKYENKNLGSISSEEDIDDEIKQ